MLRHVQLVPGLLEPCMQVGGAGVAGRQFKQLGFKFGDMPFGLGAFVGDARVPVVHKVLDGRQAPF